MTNIHPYPVFHRTPGTPTATHLTMEAMGRLHRNMAQVMYAEKRERQRAAAQARMNGDQCPLCKGKSVNWKTGRCTCDNTGLAPHARPG